MVAFVHAILCINIICVVCTGEVPVCLAHTTGECTITEPDHVQYCAGQTDTENCARYRDFEALYNRGEDELEDRQEDAKTQTNSVVFNAFIWLQVSLLIGFLNFTLQLSCCMSGTEPLWGC